MKTDVGKGFRVDHEEGVPPLVMHRTEDGKWCGPLVIEEGGVWCASSCGPVEADARTEATVRRLQAAWERKVAAGDEEAMVRRRAAQLGMTPSQIERLFIGPSRPAIPEMVQAQLFPEEPAS